MMGGANDGLEGRGGVRDAIKMMMSRRIPKMIKLKPLKKKSKGAKSSIKKGKLPRGIEPDSSQMRISSYFSKKLGIIGNGLARNQGNIPKGDAENPTKTRI